MFIQSGGTWSNLEKNFDKHKTFIVRLATASESMRRSLYNHLRAYLQNKNSPLTDKLEVLRQGNRDSLDEYEEQKYAYLITVGNLDNNKEAKLLLDKEW